MEGNSVEQFRGKAFEGGVGGVCAVESRRRFELGTLKIGGGRHVGYLQWYLVISCALHSPSLALVKHELGIMSQAALDALTVFCVPFTSDTALHGIQVAPCLKQSPPITRAQRSQNNYWTGLLRYAT